MATTIRRVDYYYAPVEDQPGEAYKLLNLLSDIGVNMVAFAAYPMGPKRTQLTLFPDDSAKLTTVAKQANICIDGPHGALLVQGDDELGALAEIHEKLFDAGVNVYASNGVTDGKGSFGYVIYLRSDQFDRATTALGI